MLLTELLTLERIRVPLAARDRRGVLRELSDLLAAQSGGDAAEIRAAVEEREAAMSTAIGLGVAIPHGRASSVDQLTLVCGLSPSPIGFDAVDGEPVRLVFLIAGPKRAAGEHVKVLGRIARLVRRDSVRTALLAAENAADFYRVLADAEVQ
jgi:PTS system fructose-specific IIA component